MYKTKVYSYIISLYAAAYYRYILFTTRYKYYTYITAVFKDANQSKRKKHETNIFIDV